MPPSPKAAMPEADAIPSLPRDSDGPVFREPWEAQAFAMALALHERGVFVEIEMHRMGDPVLSAHVIEHRASSASTSDRPTCRRFRSLLR